MIYTVSRVAKLVNLSKASIYNKLKLKEFEIYIIKKQGIIYINEEGFKLIQSDLKNYKANNPVNEEVATDTDFISTLKVDINYLKEQAKEKDLLFNNQLNEKDNQIRDLHRLIENNQILLKEKPKQDVLLLEEHFQELDTKLEEVKENMQQRKDNQKSKGFFSKIFKGDK